MLFIVSSAGRERVLFSYTAPIKNARLLHIFQCDNFCSFVNEFQKERDMTALNKKWLSGLVAGL